MKVALIQTAIVWENKQANLRRAEELLHALPAGVRLAVLPEMFSTGFSMSPGRLAEAESGETLHRLCNVARGRRIAVTGSVIAEENGAYYNRLYFVFPDGSYRTYDKRHLFSMGEEHLHYTAGNERLIVDYEGWRICPLVCYDLRFPAFSRNAGFAHSEWMDSRPVYDLLLYVANWPTARIHAWDTLLAARAIENQCYTLGVNRCGADALDVPHIGHSQAFDFKGELLCRAADNTESVAIADLSMEKLAAFREKFPAWKDADRFTMR